MTRVTRGNVARKRRQKILKITKGFRGSSSNLFRSANQQQIKALHYSTRDRHQRKRAFRALWIARINGAVRVHGINYSHFVNLLKQAKMGINRKILAQLAVYDKESFDQLVKTLT